MEIEGKSGQKRMAVILPDQLAYCRWLCDIAVDGEFAEEAGEPVGYVEWSWGETEKGLNYTPHVHIDCLAYLQQEGEIWIDEGSEEWDDSYGGRLTIWIGGSQ